ncbi:Acetyl-coenzyme A synthetase 2-like, mitochondrial [Geodia barretti]|uniref:Acetyl-coenzyme A synthetase n=1 Tax=Geodia barretti TaxID=519541 RepID=A0AA35R094_GEOBA|nr:Acetyl-coenzyme A synthetase 2-like, mitochondrial [Geodia barretti]
MLRPPVAFSFSKIFGTSKLTSISQLLESTSRIANVLKREGVKKGDIVAIYMPASPLLAATMLACARIGAIHSVVFAGFSAEALKSRILDASASVVVTADEAVRGGKTIPLKSIVDEAVGGCQCVQRVLVSQRTGAHVPMTPRDLQLEQAMSEVSDSCAPEPLDSEDPLFMLYTSGSTGKPKGILHTQAGYLLYASITQQYVFDYRPGDVYACVADIGWITGHSYVVYGPLCNGATTVLFESIPTYPDPGRYWEMVERLGVRQFYGAPTALRLLLKAGDHHVHKYDRSSLATLGCVGEPLNDEAWVWYHSVVGEGRCTVVDTWWQTETGGISIAPRPSPDDSTPKPGFPMRPFFGIQPVLVDDQGNELHGPNVSGNLCIRHPWPGMARSIYGDHGRFMDTYYRPYPGLYFSGDGARRDGEGHYQITGRVDDVINVKGHRIGTAELESCLDHDPRVAETAVVGFPHDIHGEGIYGYVILKDGVCESDEEVIKGLRNIVRMQIGGFAVPEILMIVPGLPKTRSGKIMRRILRKIAADRHDELGDVSTLADPSVVEKIVQGHTKRNNN